MTRLKVAVCEAPPELTQGSAEWENLCRLVRVASPDLLLLNELPFGWWISIGPAFSEPVWRESCARHDRGLERVGDLGAAVVATTRPQELEGRRVNQGFLWTSEGTQGVHTKQHFPDEVGYWPAGQRRDSTIVLKK
jgi:N-carbamoylputrescine amidase